MFKIFQCCTPTTKKSTNNSNIFFQLHTGPHEIHTGHWSRYLHRTCRIELPWPVPCVPPAASHHQHLTLSDGWFDPKVDKFCMLVFWLQIFHEFPMRLDISVGIFEGPLILRHTSSIHSHFGELFTSRRPPKQTLTWHDTVRIMGSQNWWFGHPRTLLSTVKPLYIGFVNDSYGSTN